MRCLLMILIGLTFADHALAQTKSSSPPASKAAPLGPPSAFPGYRMLRKEGGITLLKTYSQQGLFYTVTDLKGKVTQHLIESVVSIRPMNEEQYAEAMAALREPEPQPTGGSGRTASSTRTTANTTPRTKARTTARAPVPTPEPSYFPNSMGTTATGLPLHVGPRGGIYHYSANGNKVYQRKK